MYAQRTTNMKKVMYAIFFNSRGETVQVPTPHSKTVTGKLYQRLAMEKSSITTLRSLALGSAFKTLPFYRTMCQHHLKRNIRVLGEERLDNLPAPTLSTRFSPMLLFLASTSEKNSRGSEVSLKTGCWGSRVSVS